MHGIAFSPAVMDLNNVDYYYYLLLAGLPGVARAFNNVKILCVSHPNPSVHSKIFNPSTTCPGSSST